MKNAKMLLAVLMLLCCISFCYAFEPGWNWVKGSADLNHSSYYYQSTVDNCGNVYTALMYEGTVVYGDSIFNPASLTATNYALNKISPEGEFLWAVPLASGGENCDCMGIDTDPNGNVYVCVKYPPGTVINGVELPCLGTQNTYVAKLSSTGEFLWIKTFYGYVFSVWDIDASSNGEIVIGGIFTQSMVIDNTIMETTAGVFNAFVAKLTDSGAWLWHEHLVASGFSSLSALGYDALGNCYICVGTNAECIQLGNLYVYNASGYDIVFIAKLSPSNNWVWVEQPWQNMESSSIILMDFAVSNEGNWGLLHREENQMYVLIFDSESDMLSDFMVAANRQTWFTDLKFVPGSNLYLTGYTSGPTQFGSFVFPDAVNLTVKYTYEGVVLNAVQVNTGVTNGEWLLAENSGEFLYYAHRSYWPHILNGFQFYPPYNFYEQDEGFLQTGYLVKTDFTGQLLWVQTPWINTISSEATDLCADSEQNSYTCGNYQGGYFAQGFYARNRGFNGNDIYVAGYNSTGNMNWLASAGGSENDEVHAITRDNSGNIYIVGSFRGSAQFGSSVLVSNGAEDAFVAALDASGNWLWANSYGSNGSEEATGITFVSPGVLFITGYFSGAMSVLPYTLACQGETDIFLVKLDTDGNVSGACSAGGSGLDRSAGIAAVNNGDLFVCGNFSSTVTFGDMLITPGNVSNIFVAKLDNNLNWLWVETGSGTDQKVSDLCVSVSGNCYVTGIFSGIADFGSRHLVSLGESDAFVAKVNTENSWIWAKRFGGSYADGGNAIAVESAENILLVGYTTGNVNFGNNLSYVGAGGKDIMMAALNSDGNLLWVKRNGWQRDDVGTSVFINSDNSRYFAGSYGFKARFGDVIYNMHGLKQSFVGKLGFNVENEDDEQTPPVIDITEAYPNPFTESITIGFRTDKQANVSVSIYNLRGQLVNTITVGVSKAGSNQIHWDGRDSKYRICAPGIYTIKLVTDVGSRCRKIVLK